MVGRRAIDYTTQEDETILYFIKRGKSPRYISKYHLPHRTPSAIQERWWRIQRQTEFQPELKDVADLLSPEQKKRIRTRIPSFKNIKVIR